MKRRIFTPGTPGRSVQAQERGAKPLVCSGRFRSAGELRRTATWKIPPCSYYSDSHKMPYPEDCHCKTHEVQLSMSRKYRDLCVDNSLSSPNGWAHFPFFFISSTLIFIFPECYTGSLFCEHEICVWMCISAGFLTTGETGTWTFVSTTWVSV